MLITFNELRRIKDRLPEGSMQAIADKLGISIETVRNYFGGTNYGLGEVPSLHIEQGPDGGIVDVTDTTILEIARKMIEENKN